MERLSRITGRIPQSTINGTANHLDGFTSNPPFVFRAVEANVSPVAAVLLRKSETSHQLNGVRSFARDRMFDSPIEEPAEDAVGRIPRDLFYTAALASLFTKISPTLHRPRAGLPPAASASGIGSIFPSTTT